MLMIPKMIKKIFINKILYQIPKQVRDDVMLTLKQIQGSASIPSPLRGNPSCASGSGPSFPYRSQPMLQSRNAQDLR